jgi:hypothetical protein
MEPYVRSNVAMIGLEVALIALTLVLFATFDLFVRACDRL